MRAGSSGCEAQGRFDHAPIAQPGAGRGRRTVSGPASWVSIRPSRVTAVNDATLSPIALLVPAGVHPHRAPDAAGDPLRELRDRPDPPSAAAAPGARQPQPAPTRAAAPASSVSPASRSHDDDGERRPVVRPPEGWSRRRDSRSGTPAACRRPRAAASASASRGAKKTRAGPPTPM